MKTIAIKLYKFSELSEEAKQTAINYFQSDQDYSHIWHEAKNSLNKFCDIFNIAWCNIDPEEPYRNEYSLNLDSDVLALSGFRLAAKLWSNYKTDIFKGKYYSLWSKKDVSYEHYKNGYPVLKFRHSKIITDNGHVLTGVCYDDSLLKPIYDYLEKPNTRIDFETLLHDCINSFCHDIASEIEYQNSEEAIAETIEANEYAFTEDGQLY
jgi:hypothetical protein